MIVNSTKQNSKKILPQILMGASSSRRLGCCRKISLDFKQSLLISDSDSCTCFPGLPLTSSNRLIISSSATESIWFSLLLHQFYHENRESSRKSQFIIENFKRNKARLRVLEVFSMKDHTFRLLTAVDYCKRFCAHPTACLLGFCVYRERERRRERECGLGRPWRTYKRSAISACSCYSTIIRKNSFFF